MTTEEKARAYDEAFEKAQKELQSCGSKDCDAARQIYRFFPELSESEDEKVKRIIHSISNKISFHLHDIFTEEEFQCFDAWSNAWLEKQGKEDSSIQQAYKQGYIEGQRIERKCWLEKQVEQKPVEWTEEDESKVEDIVYFLDTAKTHYASTEAIDDCIDWLKSIKQRMEEQQ